MSPVRRLQLSRVSAELTADGKLLIGTWSISNSRIFTLGTLILMTTNSSRARHTFISHALAGGRTLAEVRDAAGHSSVLVPSAHLHVAVEDDGAVRSRLLSSRLLVVMGAPILHALAGGRTLAEVRDAAGHSSVLVTTGSVGDLFRVG